MADGSENIGGIDVSVGLDYADVAAAFATIQNQAQGAGESIAEAFNSGAGGVTTFDDAVQSASASISGCTQETLDQIAALQAAGEAEDAAAAKAKEEGAAQNEAAEAAAESAEKHGELLKTLLEFAGITLGIEALKEFAEGSIEAAASTEKATIALGALRGNAESAGEQIEDLKATAQQFAVPFESLVSINQRFAALGLTVAESRDAMHSAIEAAAAMNTSVDNAANAIDRMVLSGTAGTRQLLALGLSTNDLARAMGVATGETQKAFAVLDQEQRLEIINTALKKFGDTAEQTAAGMAGSWTKLKNATVFAMEGIGNAIGPVAAKFADLATGVLNLLTGLDRTQKAIADSEKDWQLLAVEADRAGISHKELDRQFNQLLISADNYTARLRSLIEEQGKVAPETSKATDATSKATDATSLYGAALKDAEDNLSKVSSAYQSGKATAVELISAQSQLAAAQNVYNTALDAGAVKQAYANRDIKEFVPAATAAAQGMELYGAQAIAAAAKQDSLMVGLGMADERLKDLAMAYLQAKQSGMGVEEAAAALAAGLKADEAAAKAAGVSQEQWNKIVAEGMALPVGPSLKSIAEGAKSAAAALASMLPPTEAPIKPAQTLAEAYKVLGLTAHDAEGNIETKTAQATETILKQHVGLIDLETAWTKVGGAIDRLTLPQAIKLEGEFIAQLQAAGAPEQTLLSLEEKRLQNEIKLAEQQGNGASKYMIDLANANEKTLILNSTTNILGRSYQSLMNDVNKAFSGVASNISKLIVEGGKFSAVWHEIWTKFAEDILTTVITAIEQWLMKLILSNVVARASTSATDVMAVTGQAGIAGAAAFSSVIEALPFPENVEVAPEVADAAAGAVMGSFVPLASFAGGIDYVPYDMIAQIHQGERIVTAAENSSTTNNSNPVTVQIIVNADRNPRETARQLARHLTRLSPAFSPMGAGV